MTPKPSDYRFVDIEGQRFNRLTVVSYAGRFNKQHAWNCLCDCGNETVVRGANLKNSSVQSCGCLRVDVSSVVHRKHGKSETAEFKIWLHILERCNPKYKEIHKNYAGRGISVCERWLNSFENFLLDMGTRPTPDHSIERKNNAGDYTPDNCKWATRIEQGNNKRNNRLIEWRGEVNTVAQWGRILGVDPKRLQLRLGYGWPIDRVMMEPARTQ
jgi:hypothetical protein